MEEFSGNEASTFRKVKWRSAGDQKGINKANLVAVVAYIAVIGQ